LMGSLIDELQRREAAAREEAEELRGQIAQLTERLAGVEVRPSRLVITRETVDEVLNGSGAETAPAAVMPDGRWRHGLVICLRPECWRCRRGGRDYPVSGRSVASANAKMAPVSTRARSPVR
jgi:hypothetical protein